MLQCSKALLFLGLLRVNLSLNLYIILLYGKFNSSLSSFISKFPYSISKPRIGNNILKTNEIVKRTVKL